MSGHTVPCCRYSKLAIERPRSGNEGGNEREKEKKQKNKMEKEVKALHVEDENDGWKTRESAATLL